MGVEQVACSSEMMKELTGYIAEKVVKGKKEITEDTPLVSSGLVDSFALIEIFLELQRIAGRKVPASKVASQGYGHRATHVCHRREVWQARQELKLQRSDCRGKFTPKIHKTILPRVKKALRERGVLGTVVGRVCAGRGTSSRTIRRPREF